jgi:hypothetical protein
MIVVNERGYKFRVLQETDTLHKSNKKLVMVQKVNGKVKYLGMMQNNIPGRVFNISSMPGNQ